MRVNFVSNYIKPNNTQSFKGIFGERAKFDKTATFYDYDMPNTTHIAYQVTYYPFFGETDEQIKKAIAPYQYSHYYDNEDYFEESDVEISSSLPVTREEYEAYVTAHLQAEEDYEALQEEKRRQGIKSLLPKSAQEVEAKLAKSNFGIFII
ncbi:hypothetical protein II906_03425 [bacterium]|nr:hypothetical protein [bacterium]